MTQVVLQGGLLERKELHTERMPKISKMVLQGSAHACEETTQNDGENHPKGLKGTLSGTLTGPGIMPCIPRGTSCFVDTGEGTQEDLASVIGNN